jgi:hypothetical protein
MSLYDVKTGQWLHPSNLHKRRFVDYRARWKGHSKLLNEFSISEFQRALGEPEKDLPLPKDRRNLIDRFKRRYSTDHETIKQMQSDAVDVNEFSTPLLGLPNECIHFFTPAAKQTECVSSGATGPKRILDYTGEEAQHCKTLEADKIGLEETIKTLVSAVEADKEAKAGEESLADEAHRKSLELEYERRHLHPWEPSFSPVSRYR